MYTFVINTFVLKSFLRPHATALKIDLIISLNNWVICDYVMYNTCFLYFWSILNIIPSHTLKQLYYPNIKVLIISYLIMILHFVYWYVYKIVEAILNNCMIYTIVCY